MVPRPPALETCPLERLRAVAGVRTDIDDTLTRDGAIEPAALAALHALHALRRAGLPRVAITGRPQGWSEPFARDWPVGAIVAENGAVSLIPGGAGLQVEYAQDEATRTRNAQRLRQAAARGDKYLSTVVGTIVCPRRPNFDPPCRLNFDPGLVAGIA